MALSLVKKLFTLQASDYAALAGLSDSLLDTLLRYPSLEPLVSPVAQAMLWGGISLPVVNATGSAIAANKAVSVTGWDSTTGRFKVVLADADTTMIFAKSVTHEAIANGGTGSLRLAGYLLETSGLNTTGSSLGAPVYLGAAGALSLTAGAIAQVVGYVATLAASGSIRVAVQDPNLASAFSSTADAISAELAKIVSGSATVLSGQTAITVTGLPAGLENKPVLLTTKEEPTAATSWWGSVTGTTLTITINVDNTANLQFNYLIDGR